MSSVWFSWVFSIFLTVFSRPGMPRTDHMLLHCRPFFVCFTDDFVSIDFILLLVNVSSEYHSRNKFDLTHRTDHFKLNLGRATVYNVLHGVFTNMFCHIHININVVCTYDNVLLLKILQI